ncbi:protein of unknown function [Taphrina deformans PYCC 5710]|uniref:TATA-binding protein-associated factor mot1 n=1 Tax=Taphrina deformans (strain PYCC 5710 / ATCC 11124 / CBS 356.35 / IMI 108563 / JCM 9778 / NBRC 8474) TaxID=1097556 RepID=R4XDN1_TAPDE|nr:protein of unknown function [Taphrina deformans PYCC 5710]|eukprot:CCG83717.1 protein of unknown function [Taphrina deformans PYCC 5710]
MSRLDRLVLLLDTGTPVVRNTAAEQLAQVQKAHPHELFNLLGRVVPYLKSKQWETRLAAAKAIGGIVEHVAQFDPNADDHSTIPISIKQESPSHDERPLGNGNIKEEVNENNREKGGQGPNAITAVHQGPTSRDSNANATSDITESKSPVTGKDGDDDKLSFDTFDIVNVIRNGRPLLGSAGKEYDWQGSDLSPEDRLARAKQDVTNRLGLGAEYMEKDFLSAQDLSTASMSRHSSLESPGQVTPHANTSLSSIQASPDNLPSPGTPVGEDGLSARQRNMMKRKAKMGSKAAPSKVRIVDLSSDSADRRALQDDNRIAMPVPVHSAAEKDYFSVTPQAQNGSKIVVEHKVAPQSPSSLLKSTTVSTGWPMAGLVELLSVDLFDLHWETRHGAALALREILRSQAPGAGRRLGIGRQQNDLGNKKYLDDMACRLCCIFALDRFGDYVSDQVVAPIRETISQTLAALLKHLPTDSVLATFGILSILVFQKDLPVKAWEITHGGMLGMKYLVALRKDVLTDTSDLLDGIAAAVLYALQNADDDVRAVGAATLIPITNEFVENRPFSVDNLLEVLWDCLAELRDDLSASTGSVMDLLAKLCSIPAVLSAMQAKSVQNPDYALSKLIPRLYPFLRHTITSVRRAVLRALQTFLKCDESPSQGWIDDKLLRLIFQNMLVEQNHDVLKASSEFWTECLSCAKLQGEDYLHEIFKDHLRRCISLVMTSIGQGRVAIPLDTKSFIRPSGLPFAASKQEKFPDLNGSSSTKATRKKKEEDKTEMKLDHNTDAPMLRGELELTGLDIVLRTRVAAATALGSLLAYWPHESVQQVLQSLVAQNSTSAASSPRFLTAVIVQEYAIMCREVSSLEFLRPHYEALLATPHNRSYSNLTNLLHIVRSQCQALYNAFIEQGQVAATKMPTLPVICEGDFQAGPNAFSIAQAERFIGEDYDRLRRLMASAYKGPVAQTLEDAKQAVTLAVENLQEAKAAEDIRISACNGAALVSLGQLPKKLNPVIKSLMDSIKREENPFLQRRSAEALSSLVYLCSVAGRGSAADKLIKNLCAFLCVDTSETPEFHRHANLRHIIYSLKRGVDNDAIDESLLGRDLKDAKVKHLGAQMALEGMATRFAGDLFEMIPKLSEWIFAPLHKVFSQDSPDHALDDKATSLGQEVVDGLSVLRTLVGKFDAKLMSVVIEAMPMILKALASGYATIRHSAAMAFAYICKADTVRCMELAITQIVPMLADAGSLEKRQGAIEAIQFLVTSLDASILPYVIFLIVPILGRMSDSDNDIRIVATTTFAMLVKLVPLEAGIPDPPGFSKELLAGREHERKFIQQMLDGSKVDAFEIPVAIKADLRSYQQEGVNWLAFLNKYQLHGILCDDMGLGKTLQTICIVASDHHNRSLKYTETQLDEFRSLPSLIVCPPSLSGHWQHELATYAPFLQSVLYVGPPSERKLQQGGLTTADVVITSYDIVRNDVELFAKKNFNYCVLDEGHIIKNSKAKLTQSVKLVKANHRLILSGTPIQNNVLELWSLFDFLMPGFLGTEKSFHERYAKPIANSRDSKSSSKEQESGALALEALHKQVLPFLLRRLKEEVLADLPPKIIQDYYCDLSDLQKSLYNDFTTSQASMVVQETAGEMKKEGKTHVFQALQYMRKLCNHPALVLNAKHPKYDVMLKDLSSRGQTLRDVQHAPKLLALRDLLVDCGIGNLPSDDSKGNSSALTANVVNQHRVLIFCQIKDMLDMVENDVLKKLLPSVSYMRLDGTTDPRNRQGIVQQFNADPSIDVLLLTTHVGGLGLNLTGADTVIFVEHDWNPMKDLQAMDRAHRIGQKKTVNVYRLITRGTLEEKIMGLQKFKMNIASTIVNQQNSGLATMETDQILDLFNVQGTKDTKAKDEEGGVDSQGNIIKKGQKSVFDDLDALHDESEYADFDVDTFVQTL